MYKYSDTPAFTPQRFQEERDKDKGKVFTIRLNEEEVKALRKAQNIMQQEKDSTTVKQLAMFGLYVLHDRSTAYILDVLGNNIRKNRRNGIEEVDVKE
jgi:hypothetical protein